MKKSIIRIRVITRASRQEVIKTGKDAYKIRIHAAPEGGRANAHIISILSQTFSLPKSHIAIIRGLKSKNKVIEIFMEQ